MIGDSAADSSNTVGDVIPPILGSTDNVRTMDEASPDRVRRITVRRFASNRDADAHDLEFWRQMSAAERVLHAWRLSQELWRLRGEYRDEPGLCRSVARVHRR